MALGMAFGGPTNFGQIVSMGAPVLPSMGGLSPFGIRGGLPTGLTLYVCSLGSLYNAGYGDGSDITAPLATVSSAMTKLNGRTNKGDQIICLPGHVETVNAADFFSATGAASGFSIIGLGSGFQRPTFNFTAAGSTWLFDTIGMEIANCVLNFCGNTATGALTVATPMTVSAAGGRFVYNYINWGQDTDTGCGSVLGAISVTAANFDFIGNTCVNLDTAGTLALSLLALNGADNCQIIGNRITGGTTSTTVAAVHFLTTASLNVNIQGNFIENTRASSTKSLSSAISGVTGIVANNLFRNNSGILGFTVSANLSVSAFNNYTNNTVNKNGALDVGAGTSA